MAPRPGPGVGAGAVLRDQEAQQRPVVPLHGPVTRGESRQVTRSGGQAGLRQQSLSHGLRVTAAESQQPGSPGLAALPLSPREGPHLAPLLGGHHLLHPLTDCCVEFEYFTGV